MNLIRFVKMQGLGNDFAVIDARGREVALSRNQICSIADRRRGVGCDQVILMQPPPYAHADVFMQIYNADGSRSAACGNATRCVALLMMREMNLRRTTVATEAGLLDCAAEADGTITVDMGQPRFDWRDIPLAHSADTTHLPIAVGPFTDGVAVNVGNPHAVFFVDAESGNALAEFGATIEHDPLFPEGVNVGAAQVLAPDRIDLRVWERGTGLTPACGSGACAAVVAAVRRGLADRRVVVLLPGGELTIHYRDDDRIMMSGAATTVFTGILDPSLATA